MAIQAKAQFSIFFNADGISSSLQFDLRDIPVALQISSGSGSFTPNGVWLSSVDLSRATNATVSIVSCNGSNITGTILSATFADHNLTITFSSAPANAAGVIGGELVF